MGWRGRRSLAILLCVIVDEILCKQWLSINSHFATVETLELVVFRDLAIISFGVTVHRSCICSSGSMGTDVTADQEAAGESRARRIAQALVLCRGVEVFTQLLHAVAGEHAEDAALVVGEF